jgi:hypothetical protein
MGPRHQQNEERKGEAVARMRDWAYGGSLGSAQESEGGEKGQTPRPAARWEADAGARKLGQRWAESHKERKILFFFLFQFFKAFSKYILNSLLNLIQTTQYKISNAAA